jgi:hypothetical protein
MQLWRKGRKKHIMETTNKKNAECHVQLAQLTCQQDVGIKKTYSTQ